MNWDAFKTHELGYRAAFETLNNQLFERHIKRTYGTSLGKFRVVNGSGGDGGVEAYAELNSGSITAIQSKWFRQSIDDSEIGQIRKSILTAKKVRPQINEYIICIPHDVSSKKIGRGKVIISNDEESRINELVDSIYLLHPDLTLVWWFDSELLNQIQHPDNEGVYRYWFEKEILSWQYLHEHFLLKKQNHWLKERYIPELHGTGIIYSLYQRMLLSEEYRKELGEKLTQTNNKLEHCIRLISQYLATKEYPDSLISKLEETSENLKEFSSELIALRKAIGEGNESFKLREIPEKKTWQLTLELEQLSLTHRQKSILPQLIRLLRDIYAYDLPKYLTGFANHLHERIKLVRGGAGTGKTQGLANCTEQHLIKKLPAIIIQAKGTPCHTWTAILSQSLELPTWNKTDIFSALEALAASQDIIKAGSLPPGQELEDPPSKVLICIDGLEEETSKEKDWRSRISECTTLTERYPRLLFLFSSREYFPRHCIDAYHPMWEEVNLPREGDVPIERVAADYVTAYRIGLDNLSLIKGLDSLLALRLFCEYYEGQIITSGSHIVTATKDLLKLKVQRINDEFLSSLPDNKGQTEQPVFDALLLIAERFYYETEIEHTQLQETLAQRIGNAFSSSEVNRLLDFLVQYGILIRTGRTNDTELLPKTVYHYRITYQSIIEHILSEKIYRDIKNARIDAIPAILHEPVAVPFGTAGGFSAFQTPPNQKIIQSIVSQLFADTGKLIGKDGFLAKGFLSDDILAMQLEAIRLAPKELALSCKEFIDGLFLGKPKEQFYVLKYLIVPSSHQADSVFGSEYLHNILINQVSAFERDKLWSGLDRLESYIRKADAFDNNVKSLLDRHGITLTRISEYADYNETPLLYAWALTNIDQTFRESLRISLTEWVIKRPLEFLRLLDKIFFCNDPQIQEDMAAVILGIAGHTNEKEVLLPLAEWALKFVFVNRESLRNVIVRQGFRAIVEKAYLAGAISESDVEQARPSPLHPVRIIDLQLNQIQDADGESYPIVHDLAWYVIKEAYNDFLEYPSAFGDTVQDNDCPEAKAMLDLYRVAYQTPDIYAHGWAVAAAISYIRNILGLTRTDGNHYTDKTHGSKSQVYTYEEKYTWLAVHYLQGYLSDYIPMDEGEESRVWIRDYSKITDIPNPGEEVVIEETIDYLTREKGGWIIKEDLAPTISVSGNVSNNIKMWTEQEPAIDFARWLSFSDTDFPQFGTGRDWLALYNYTALEDASHAGFSQLSATACLLQKDELEDMKNILINRFDGRAYFITHLDGLKASPDTDTYSNPGDIVWMNWIEEYSDGERVYLNGKDSKLFYTITTITQSTTDGEKYYLIPSKKVRSLLEIKSFLHSELLDATGRPLSFTHEISEGSYRDTQRMLLADHSLLTKKLQEQNLQICWFVDFFKQKNPLNEAFKSYPHTQKSRKYFVWLEDGSFHSFQFWDAYFNNTRDEKRKRSSGIESDDEV